MHEFNNRPFGIITPLFFANFWHYKKFIHWPHCIIFQHVTSLLQEMQYCGKLHNLSFCLSYMPIPKLGNNNLSTMRNKQLMVFGILAILGVIQFPLLHISSNVFLSFLLTYIFTKKIPLSSKDFIFPFHLIANLTLDSVGYHLIPSKILPMVVL